ncbi:molybdenum cofactor biosynthesis protein [Peptococcaceae bacterium SCADC1_2_3]|jgi:molybdopterin molybdotransferase|nr:molybdenum cofactor biosynthesis protein [Peptococcaceae bacterium SCADC1_2_3]KFI35873.1 molybdenum cofactor biosynthesis protein [Peptococcaceae bacterium SCADC1_2_3]KFI37161.1 molybdenum cofactor biosynthesis protein [Peptococcaceae bacterium SCADC1_2_3]
MTELFKAVTITEARKIISAHYSGPKKTEMIPLLSAQGRRLAEEVRAKEDVPGFTRSTVDGFAVQARDTFGASEGLPDYLEIAGEVFMGEEPKGRLETGQVWQIATGGMLPAGADAVVMVEYTENLEEKIIGVVRPVAPGENVIRQGEDIAAGSLVLPFSHCVKAHDLGVLAAAGVTAVKVFCPLRVGIVSTGDEVVPPEEKPVPGKVRDINSYALYGAVTEAGGQPHLYGIVRDDFHRVRESLSAALSENDLVMLSGGSSVGTRDVAREAINSLGNPGVLFHGLSIQPGKPTIGAAIEGKLVFGLPGHPASALVVFHLLVAPLLYKGSYYEEENGFWEFPLTAQITRNIRSAPGREDFIRVKLFLRQGNLYAEPILGKSGLITTLVKANGLARITAGKEGVEAGETVEVKLF